MSLRLDVYDIDGGRCVSCRKRLPRSAGIWSWHVHHVLKQQWLKARGLPSAWWRTPIVAVLLCRRCHERHESRTAPVPRERLPARVIVAVGELGFWAEDRLAKYHPSRPAAARGSRSQ